MHHLISGINCLTLFVDHVLVCLFLIHHIFVIILLHQCHYHHSCYPSLRHSFISISRLSFFSNPTLHRHLAPPRTDYTAIQICSRFIIFFSFFLSFSFRFFVLLTFFAILVFFLFQSFSGSFMFHIIITVSIFSISRSNNSGGLDLLHSRRLITL